MMKATASRGFTLIELMIAVAIVAILASVAYPSYTDYLRKGRRAEARSVILEAAQWMERFYTQNQRYDQNTAGTATTDNALFYANYKYSPKSTTQAGHYQLTLTVSNASPNAYTLTAAPMGAMTGDKCGSFVTNQTGARGNTGYSGFASASAAAQSCWAR